MNENLISILERQLLQYRSFFAAGIIFKMRRFFSNPVKILIRMSQLKVWKNKFFLVKTKTFFGYTMTIHSFEYCLWFSGCLDGAEIGLQKYLIKHIQKNEVFMDIGAHHGFYSLLAHRLTDSALAQVHAFEPTDTHFPILKQNTKDYGNIVINKRAVCSGLGDRVFYETLGAGRTIEKNFFKNVASVKLSDFKEIKISCVTLDAYCAEKNIKPTFLKIDVEGSEYEVLLGGKKTIEEYHPVIVMEVWSKPHDNTNHIKAIDFLREMKYQAFKIKEDGEIMPIEYFKLIESLSIPNSSDNYLFQS